MLHLRHKYVIIASKGGEDYMNTGEKIKFLRVKANLTLEQVAEKVGVGKSTVRKWETGMIANMKRDKIAALAKALNTTPAYLMGWEDDENNKSPPEKKEKTTPVEDGLSDAQRALIQFARTVPEEKAELILRVMKSILEDD
jgi:transcriptional regulator with XRE-family HTH domain